METAAVYTDYVPNAKKIIFSADTPDTVSDLPPASSALGTFTLPKTVPKRAGFEFVGWATVSGGETSVLPGEQIEIYADTTFYAVWKSSYKISLSPNTLRNNTFESLPNVPNGDFIAEVTLTNIAWNCRCIPLIATHGKGGQMADLCTVYIDLAAGQSITISGI